MKIKYTGVLAKPMPHARPPGLLASDAQVKAWAEERVSEWRKRMDALFDFHRIQRDNWNMLAGTLADCHVPGFAEEKARRGAKTKWDEMKRADLKIAVDDYIRAVLPKRTGIAAAIRVIARQQSWKAEVSRSTNPVAALRKQYDLADVRWVRMKRLSNAWEIHEKNPEMPLNEVNAIAGVEAD